MRSIVLRLESEVWSARRAHSVSSSPVTPGIVAGRPIPISMRWLLVSTRKLARVVLDELPAWAHEMLRSARVGRLGLLDERDRPRVLPVTFAMAAGAIYSAVDRKPKRSGEPVRALHWRADATI